MSDTLRRLLLRPERNTSPVLSPDGSVVAHLRQDPGAVTIVAHDGRAARPVAVHRAAQVDDLVWAHDDLLLYRLADAGGRRLVRVRVSTGETRALEWAGAVLRFWTSAGSPDDVVIAGRAGPGTPIGLFRADLEEASVEPVAVPPSCHDWFVDPYLEVRGGAQLLTDGGLRVLFDEMVHTVEPDSSAEFLPLTFDADGSGLYVLDSTGRPRRGLWRITAAGRELVYEHDELDIASFPIGGHGVWFDPQDGRPVRCSVFGQKLRYIPLAGRTEPWLADPHEHEQRLLLDTDRQGRTSLIALVRDNAPMGYALADHATGQLTDLTVNRPELTGAELPGLEDLDEVTFDGRTITGYAMPSRTAPAATVVMVHGGPAARDIWRFNAESHVFAAAGYRCLQVNFRGSTGRGRDFRLAGYGQWGDGMLRDLYAVVADGIERNTIDPERIAFFGMSYGGYAALLAAADRPDLVRCAVAINPVCDLVSFAADPPPFWRVLAPTLRRQVGPAGEDQSPLHRLHAGAAPALLAWGARDPRIDTGDINRYLARATETGARVTPLRYADDGHLITEGREHLFTEILAFLGRELS